MDAQSQGVNRVALIFGTMLTACTNRPECGVSRRQLLQQRLRLLQVARVEPLSAATSMKSGLFETLQHMVVRCLRAVLRGEPLSV